MMKLIATPKYLLRTIVLLVFLLTTGHTKKTKRVPKVPALAGIIRHDAGMEKYLEMGGRSEFACVGRYATSENSNDYAVGVLISPNWVLTAAHFVEDSSVWLGGRASPRPTRRPRRSPRRSGRQVRTAFRGILTTWSTPFDWYS